MAKTQATAVNSLKLDLSNFRTVRQASETQAVQAMIAVSPDRFWALMESLIDDGYLPTENILVLAGSQKTPNLVVKEGNRRIAALKLIHGYLSNKGIQYPVHIAGKIKTLSPSWKKTNAQVPCTIYPTSAAATVDRIITLAHGKNEKAGRDQWNAVARARHNRDVNKASEPALDLLEKYLTKGKNVTSFQSERWAGHYPLTVLEDAMKRISTRLGATSAPDLAKKYPAIKYRDALEKILHDIGVEIVKFSTIRSDTDFAVPYGVPAIHVNTQTNGSGANSTPSQGTGGKTATGKSAASSTKKVAAVAVTDPKGVVRTLKKFAPLGDNRDKVVALRDEAVRLKIDKTPIAFCFLLRSMFEISAKAYCADHKSSGGPSVTKNGLDRKLVDVLRDVTKHLTKQNSDKEMMKVLHGAMTELGKHEGILSVTSLNQLVHNPSFSVLPGDVCVLFRNVFPLLDAMNK